jgi:pilus assembly protein CpaF
MFRTERETRSGESYHHSDERLTAMKQDVHAQLLANMDLSAIERLDDGQLRAELRRGAEELFRQHGHLVSAGERQRLVDEIIDETLGLGPLESLLADETISDILINGPKTVYVERNGCLERSSITFRDDNHLVDICQRIATTVGRRLDESSPMVDARLEDGSRVNAVIRPLALDGALVSIRRFPAQPLMAADLIDNATAAAEMIEFLGACVQSRLNIVISGGTGSGKTTLLNVLSGYIPHDQRVATIEDAAELRLQQPHVARMETRQANLEGSGEITARDLLRNSLRMRPDRIIVGECRSDEAFDMLQAMNTGHDGSLTTIHANDTREALNRLEMLVGMAGYDLPLWFIHRQLAAAIQIVVQVSRLSGGRRKITQVSEVTGCDGEVIGMHDVFTFEQTGMDTDGRAVGRFQATGIRPHCVDRIKSAGINLPFEMFDRRELVLPTANGAEAAK